MRRKIDATRQKNLGSALVTWVVSIVILVLIIAGILYFRHGTEQPQTAALNPPTAESRLPGDITTAEAPASGADAAKAKAPKSASGADAAKAKAPMSASVADAEKAKAPMSASVAGAEKAKAPMSASVADAEKAKAPMSASGEKREKEGGTALGTQRATPPSSGASSTVTGGSAAPTREG